MKKVRRIEKEWREIRKRAKTGHFGQNRSEPLHFDSRYKSTSPGAGAGIQVGITACKMTNQVKTIIWMGWV
jgi:hypothetical protein